MSFDGVDDYVEVPAQVLASTKVTVSARVFFKGHMLEPAYPVEHTFIVEHGAYDTVPGFNLWIYGDGWCFQISDGTIYTVSKSGAKTTNINKWTHDAGTYDGDTMKLYINGVLGSQYTVSNVNFGNNIRTYIGRMTYRYREFYGFIAEVLIYSRALSAEEVAWNYRYPWNPIRNGLVLYLTAHPSYVKDIDGDGVFEWLDLSGFGNHGKIYGATLVEVIKSPSRILSPSRVIK